MFTTLALQTMMLAYPAPRDREPPDKGPGFLGVTFEAGNMEGVLVTEVRPDGPADKAGLKVDDVIVKFNGESITFETFAKKIVRIRPGTVIPLDVQRASKNMVIKVRIGVRPDDFPFPLPDQEDLRNSDPPPLIEVPPPLPPK